MGWADRYVEKLRAGETVQFRPRGNSMRPRIESGALVTVEPIRDDMPIKVGDVVLAKVRGAVYLHIAKAFRQGAGVEVLIGNNHGGVNGWTAYRNVYGRCVRVEP